MEGTSHCLIFLIFLLSCSTDPVLPVRLTVSPSRSQFYQYEPATLICEDGWTVRRNTSTDTRKQCGDDGFGSSAGSTCTIKTLYPSDTGLYWCESINGSSSSSSSIQLSVSGGSVILQSPVLPVMEGDDVTLSCRAKNPTHNLPAAFYKDGSFIGDETTGNKILNSVKKSDEGLYKCNVKGHGESPSSRISVKEKLTNISDSTVTPGPGSSSVSLPVLLPSASLCVLFFLFLLVQLVVYLYSKPKVMKEEEERMTSLPETSGCSRGNRRKANQEQEML
ncbi:vascular cell adhesion protein 1-like isoform X2 [Xiphophorus hellerii]|uniref:vascular cell adhesion protein 1-like isoform X2 n=1 Tax=Xiphophorus hellerii TaxID=8084 RepID=UPI0013B3676D|nr:vascular cell adhesion protein 1-like isoform X2 [Xiphophorus hellerii]